MEVVADLHRSIRKRIDGILLEQRVSNLLDSIEVELIGKVSTDGIGVWRVFCRLADVIDRGPLLRPLRCLRDISEAPR